MLFLKKMTWILCSILILSACETSHRSDAPNLGKKLAAATNSGKVVEVKDLDDYGRTNFQMAYQYFLNREFSLSQDKLDLTLKRYPRFPEGYNLLGILEENMGRIDIAAASYRKSFEMNPNYVVAYSNYSRLMCKKGLAAMELEAKNGASPGLATAIAECAVRQQQYSTALMYADQAIRMNPQYGQPYLVKAAAHNGMGDQASAIIALDQFHNLDGYLRESVQLGIEIAGKLGDSNALKKYQDAMQRFTQVQN